jgi:hypothetical protein
VRLAFVTVVSCLGSACTGVEPPPQIEHEAVLGESRSVHAIPEPLPPPSCPAGTERRELGGEGPDRHDWWCARGEVRHGPFLYSTFDNRRRNWFEVRGEHVDGRVHGLVRTERNSGGSIKREWFDDGARVHGNEATTRVDIEAGVPVVTRRFRVKASGLAPTVQWQDEAPAIGSFDVEVWTKWVDAPADAPPSVLRVELASPATSTPTRADALLHPDADPEPPETSSDLPAGEVPTLTVPWATCVPPGCELELAVTFRWLVSGPGRVEAYVTTRAVPYEWPEAAPIEVTAIED